MQESGYCGQEQEQEYFQKQVGDRNRTFAVSAGPAVFQVGEDGKLVFQGNFLPADGTVTVRCADRGAAALQQTEDICGGIGAQDIKCKTYGTMDDQ